LIVLDATVAVDASLTARGLDTLRRHGPIAPALLWSEATATLRQLVWRDLIDAEAGRSALDRLLDAPIERRSSRRLYEEALRIAASLGWARTYDAEYVALAKLHACRLVTLDGRLRRGAGHIVEIVGPTEL